ncbi:MAG: pantetheine-phosphate adenylyltransferase [Treponema sp.]|jgi:pantetheine-phosphate adenylyltransferase|nr:pantetheine-phosphate adenylyltransferase [Treponema sp.]
MIEAIFPGTFDPPTNGHINIIQRASKLFDKIDVVIAVNKAKNCLFSPEERLDFLKELVRPYKNVTVHTFSGLIVDYASQKGANVLIRGIRNSIDFSYEFDLSLMNHRLNANIETLFIPTDQKYLVLKSSSIKELAQFGGDVSGMVPENVRLALEKKYRNS